MAQLLPFIGTSEFARNVLARIESEGYVVLPGVLNESEVEIEYTRMWRWLELVAPGVRRMNPRSWRRQGSGMEPWPCSQRDMMQLHQAGWVFSELRELMAERVFEKLYGTRELHCSKDGFTLQRPTLRELNRSPNDHFDQGCQMQGLTCIQGSVALTDQEFEDGCFLCWPGSHKHHAEIIASRGPKGGRQNFVILNDREKDLLRSHGIEAKRVPVRRGDVILWRSDLAHCGGPPMGRRENFRAVVYICMLPSALTPARVYPEKQRAYQQLETGSHWPNQEEWFTQRRDSRFEARPFFETPPVLSARQRLLYGLERYTPQAVLQTKLISANRADTARVDVVASGAFVERLCNACQGPCLNPAQHFAESPPGLLAGPLLAATVRPSRARRWGASRAKQESPSLLDGVCLPACSESMTRDHKVHGAYSSPAAACLPPSSSLDDACLQAYSESVAESIGQLDTCTKAQATETVLAVDTESMQDVQRLKKALREIAALERRVAAGFELRQNQLHKLNKKDECQIQIERLNGEYSDS